VKQVPTKITPSTRERSERSVSQTQRNTGSLTSFFFHPVTQIYVFTPLLSSFTHTHVYASACAYRRTRMRGVEKEERKLRSPNAYPRSRQGWPTFASLRVSGFAGQSPALNATRGHTLACGTSANVADPIGTSP
jgi:hypothetical protein